MDKSSTSFLGRSLIISVVYTVGGKVAGAESRGRTQGIREENEGG